MILIEAELKEKNIMLLSFRMLRLFAVKHKHVLAPKTATIIGMLLFTLVVTTNAFALISWSKSSKQIKPAVSSLLAVKDANCTGGYCLFANQLGESLFLSEDGATSPGNWKYCGVSKNSSFGKDRTSMIPTNAYIFGSGGGVQLVTTAGSPGSTTCQVTQYAIGHNTDSVVAFLKTTAKNAYYVKDNSATDGTNDTVEVTGDNGATWNSVDPFPSTNSYRINDIDGDNTAGKVFIATSNGLYQCSGANYPACTTWTAVSPQPSGSAIYLNRVLYKYTSATNKLLVVGGNTGLYVSTDEGATWNRNGTSATSTTAIVPTTGSIITGIAADADKVYVTSYAMTASALKANGVGAYSPKNIIQDYDHDQGQILQGMKSGGVTIYDRRAANGSIYTSPSSLLYSGVSYQNDGATLDKFYGNAVLGVSLLVDDNDHATHIYVPALIGQDNGGYSIGTESTTTYTATMGPAITCYPSGKVVAYPYTCPTGDIGKVICANNGSMEGGTTCLAQGRGVHGYVVALTEQSTNTPWYPGGSNTTNATGQAIGAGMLNTDKIIGVQGYSAYSSPYAAMLCANNTLKDGQGVTYRSWVLPSTSLMVDIAKMYQPPLTTTNSYWTSWEASSEAAGAIKWYEKIPVGWNFGSTNKSNTGLMTNCVLPF